MNDQNKILVRSTGYFKYKNPVNEHTKPMFPGDKFILNLGLKPDRVQLAHILHPNYINKGFVLIEPSEIRKLKNSKYFQDYQELAKSISVDQAMKIEKFEEYKRIENEYVPLFEAKEDAPRLKYEGAEEKVKFNQPEPELDVPAPVEVEAEAEAEVEEAKNTEAESIEKTHFAQDKEHLENIHYKKLQKIAEGEADLEYDTKVNFINILLDIDVERFEKIYDAYLND